MGWDYTDAEYETWQLAERGGAQGDYRDGVRPQLGHFSQILPTCSIELTIFSLLLIYRCKPRSTT